MSILPLIVAYLRSFHQVSMVGGIKANNLKIYLPIEGLNSSKFEMLEQFKKIFPDKFF